MGNTPAKQDTEKWNNINTEEISSTIPYMTGMSKESTNLKNMLQDILKTDSESSVDNVFMKKYDIKDLESDDEDDDETSVLDEIKSDLSTTSPFITSDMYKKMVNSNKESNNMEGGGINDSSSTSTTSEFKNNVNVNNSTEKISTINSTMTGGEFSYQSSSAHTSGDMSESEEQPQVESTVVEDNNDTDSVTEVDTDEEEKKEESDSDSSVNLSTMMEGDDSDKDADSNKTTEKSDEEVEDSSSINTSDINMVTADN